MSTEDNEKTETAQKGFFSKVADKLGFNDVYDPEEEKKKRHKEYYELNNVIYEIEKRREENGNEPVIDAREVKPNHFSSSINPIFSRAKLKKIQLNGRVISKEEFEKIENSEYYILDETMYELKKDKNGKVIKIQGLNKERYNFKVKLKKTEYITLNGKPITCEAYRAMEHKVLFTPDFKSNIDLLKIFLPD